MIRVTVWNEYLHEKEEPVRHIYPNGIHGCIKEFLQTDEELAIKTATFEMPEHGLTDEVLAQQMYLFSGVTCARMSFQMRWQRACAVMFVRVWDLLHFIRHISQKL